MSEVNGHKATCAELPKEVFKVLIKPNRAVSPAAIVATVDSDGTLMKTRADLKPGDFCPFCKLRRRVQKEIRELIKGKMG